MAAVLPSFNGASRAAGASQRRLRRAFAVAPRAAVARRQQRPRSARASAAPRRDVAAPAAAPEELSRRGLLALAAALPALPALQLLAPQRAAAAAAVDWAAVRKDIRAVISDASSPGGIGEKGPTLVRTR